MDIKSFAEAYASIYESKKKDDEKPKKWHDDDGDGISYEDGEVDGKFDKKKKKKKDDEDDVKEAIDFAADYFLEEGIEEEELDVIIEDVGLDDFVEFVNEDIEKLQKKSCRATWL